MAEITGMIMLGDLDANNLGDTLIPYNSSGNIINGGDYLPLLIPPNHPSVVTITSPVNGSIVSGIITIYGKASDEDGDESITKVEVKIDDGEWIIANGTTSWSYSWDTTSVANGDYTIQVRAYDGHEYSSIASITVTVKNERKEKDNIWIYIIVVIILIILIVIIAYLILSRRK
ncbi:MAG: hypothetical protein FE048_05385 [Thermoplasmata archaeon]|nr:MAG: hypothetical protein FE048_05385 [Thermoplasmata archaeon]